MARFGFWNEYERDFRKEIYLGSININKILLLPEFTAIRKEEQKQMEDKSRIKIKERFKYV